MRNQKIKIAFMFGGMNRGGAETLMLDVFQNWQKADFGIIGIHRKGGICRDAFYQAGPKCFQIFPKRYRYITYFYQLRRCIQINDIDIIHAQHWLDCIYARIATVGLKVKIINTFHGFYKITGFMGWLCRLSMRWADAICFVSDYEKKWYQEKCRLKSDKLYTIYNGVNFNKFSQNTQLLSPLPISPHDDGSWPKLVMVGSFGRGRTQDVISKAIALLKKDGICNFEFYFVGAKNLEYPYLYDNNVSYCQEEGLLNVHFLGGREDVPAILNNVDGFAYSTSHDTFGIAAVEAMAVGLPTIVNDWEVMKEITQLGKFALLFKSDDEQDCAEKMAVLLELCRNKERKQDVAQQIRQHYSIGAYIDKLNNIYNLF